MPAASGYPKVVVQVTFVAAIDKQNNVLESWWSFTPDQAELQYTGSASNDKIVWKLRAYTVDGDSLKGAKFPAEKGVTVGWPYNQPTRQGSTTYATEVPNVATPTDPLGPFPFSATVQYKNNTYSSPDPEVVFEPGGN